MSDQRGPVDLWAAFVTWETGEALEIEVEARSRMEAMRQIGRILADGYPEGYEVRGASRVSVDDRSGALTHDVL